MESIKSNPYKKWASILVFITFIPIITPLYFLIVVFEALVNIVLEMRRFFLSYWDKIREAIG